MMMPAVSLAQPPAPAEATFSDAEFGQIAKLLTGSWKASGVKAGEGTADIVLSLAPVSIKGVENAMYAEVARAEAIEAPYRQTILQFHKEGGTTHIRTYTFNSPGGEVHCLRTIWAAPEAFPSEVSVEQLTPTTDMAFTQTPEGWHGNSAPFASSVGGAANISSEMLVGPATLKVADRGTAADGSLVWGPAPGEWMTFERTSTGVSTSRLDDGLIVINYPSTIRSEKTPVNNDFVLAQYIGSLGDGTIFDTSYERGTPYKYAFDEPILMGWKRAMGDAKAGMKRKLIIPGPLGLGEQGFARKGVGPNATLYFQLEVLDIQERPKAEKLPPVEIKPDVPGAPKPLEFKPTEVREEKHDHPH
jgi:hypothetical protein